MITARWKREKQFEVEIRGHKLLLDQPRQKGGGDAGPTPSELLGAALAACSALYALPFLQRRGLPADGLEVLAHMETERNPARIGRVTLELTLPKEARAKLAGEEKEALRRAAHACYVQQSIAHGMEIELRMPED